MKRRARPSFPSPARLDFSAWSDWLLSDRVSPLFFRSQRPADLRSEPSSTSTRVAEISGDYILQPLEVRGDWMRVELRQPSDYCQPEVTPTVREGWIRWYDADIGPLVWYFSRGC